jgi:hypothetical protein
MSDPTLQPIINRINALYGGKLDPSESLEAALNLTGFMGLLLEIADENGGDLDDVPA